MFRSAPSTKLGVKKAAPLLACAISISLLAACSSSIVDKADLHGGLAARPMDQTGSIGKKRQKAPNLTIGTLKPEYVALQTLRPAPRYFGVADYICTPSGFGRMSKCSLRNGRT